MSEKEQIRPIVVVRRRKRGGGGHHGGAWKVAYADFVTAMMAFFLVMWLLGAATNTQKAAISEYFKNPSMTAGTVTQAPAGIAGPGGASDSMIDLHGSSLRMPHGSSTVPSIGEPPAPVENPTKRASGEADAKRLEALRVELEAAIQKSAALAPFKDQLLLDITPEGLRIQIVDKQNRAMFDTGSARLKLYTTGILHELAHFINGVPNEISISGHTDATPYGGAKNYTNWELSADRANAARRALVEGGMHAEKVARVVGLSDTVPLDRHHPGAAINRRISIVVMTKEAAAAALKPELASAGGAPQAVP